MSSLKQQVAKGLVWVTLEKLSTQFVGFFVTMILTRLLAPTDYGMVSMLGIFVFVSMTLADAGLGRALVQKKDASQLDFNTMFYASLVLAGIVYAILFISAPEIARWYGIPKLNWVLRVISFCVIFHSIEGVQQAELNRNLRFDLSFKINIISSIVNMVTGVTLAYCGCGVWALVWSQFTSGLSGVVARWFFIAWRPAWMFSWSSLMALWGFGWRMTASGLIDVSFSQLSGLLIGKIYTPADLAYVDRAGSIPNLAMATINQSITRVTYPALARVQDEKAKAREAMRKMIRESTYLVFPMMVGCAACGTTLIPLLFGEQWLPAIPYVWIACLSSALMPFHTINLNCIAALGRSDIFLKLEILKKTLGLLFIILFIREGVFAFVLIRAIVLGPLSVVINAWPNRKLLHYSVLEQIRDVAPSILLSLVMGGCVWSCSLLPIDSMARLALQISCGVVVYGGLSWLLKFPSFYEYLNLGLPVFLRLKNILKGFLP